MSSSPIKPAAMSTSIKPAMMSTRMVAAVTGIVMPGVMVVMRAGIVGVAKERVEKSILIATIAAARPARREHEGYQADCRDYDQDNWIIHKRSLVWVSSCMGELSSS
jgi:hypothetical protein